MTNAKTEAQREFRWRRRQQQQQQQQPRSLGINARTDSDFSGQSALLAGLTCSLFAPRAVSRAVVRSWHL